jgi:hypothetical protein
LEKRISCGMKLTRTLRIRKASRQHQPMRPEKNSKSLHA